MQIIENTNVKEKLYIEKLENGLTVMIIPKKGIQKKYVMWATNYGSMDNQFIIPGEKETTKVPEGIAHYLEHKMFEQPDGTNSLDTLTALGVNANAYTSNNHTAYLFESTNNFYPALDELMDYVQHPYFTEENVEKERGIIGQEIMMYDDYPEWVVYMNAIRAMYKNSPIRADIAGTIESIAKIDKDVLYKCYNTFYHPSNMIFAISGDVNPEEMLEEIKKRLIKKEKQGEIKRIEEDEPEEIVEKQQKTNMEVSMPLFVIGIKDFQGIETKITAKKHMTIEVLLNMIIGKSSKLYKKLYNNRLLMSEVYGEYEFAKNYAHVAITGQSPEPETILKEIQEEINNLKQNEINQEQFERVKKMIYGSYVKEYDDVADVVRMFVSDYFKGINSFDYIEAYKEVTTEYAEQILEEVFKEEKTVLSIVNPKK